MQLLWALVNIAAIVTFLGLCMEATKLLRHSIGKAASIIFVVMGIMAFAGQSSNKKSNNPDVKELGMISPDSLIPTSIKFFKTELDDNLVSHTDLVVKYGQDANGVFFPIDAFSGRYGLEIGVAWRPETIIVQKSQDSTSFNYTVFGMLEWKLLGATVQSQHKTYTNIP